MRRKRKSNRESNNFQDKAEVKEFKKGFRAGRGSKACGPIKGQKDGNDISWHNPNAIMFNGATGVTFNARVGFPFNLDPGAEASIPNWNGNEMPSPGILTMHWAPSLGQSTDPQSPINEAAISLFQYLRKDKSGREIYQPADVAMVIGALDSAYMFYEFCCKVYGMCGNVDIFNSYVPESMMAAHSVNFKSINNNKADYKFWLADFARQLRGFYVPKGIHLFDRHAYMTRQIFTDSNTMKAQYYAYVPTHYFVFQEGTESNPQTMLNYSMLINPATMGSAGSSNWLTFEDLVNFGNSLLHPLKQSETVRNITADMLTAFPENGSYSIGDIPDDYVVKPVYDEQALMMLENSFTYGYANTLSGGYNQVTSINNSYITDTTTITPNAASIPLASAENQSKVWNAIQRSRQVLNFHKSDVTKEDIMYASRLSGFGFLRPIDEDGTASDAQLLKTHGSELPLDWTMWWFKSNNSVTSPNVLTSETFSTYQMFRWQYTSNTTIVAALSQLISQFVRLSMFDWHPKVYYVPYWQNETSTGTVVEVMPPMFDLDVNAIIEESQLEQMNLTSLLGLLICRDMGAYSRSITN